MSLGAILEPLVVVSLLAGGALVNRNTSYNLATGASPVWQQTGRRSSSSRRRVDNPASPRDLETGKSPAEGDVLGLGAWTWSSNSSTSSLTDLTDDDQDPTTRLRTLRFFGWKRTVRTPNTEVFRDRLLSRVLRRFPFLVETWYWALIYWVYQLGRAFTALTLDDGTVDVARKHALQVIHLEQRLHIFLELPVQAWFLKHPFIMLWTNRIYSFIHIPGTILFLIILFYLTTTRPTRKLQQAQSEGVSPTRWSAVLGRFGPHIYEKRRRTMAMCNLIAFIVFTFWPCMPPRLLSDPEYNGEHAEESKGYGFVDTVHGADGESSVWTSNRFCNQYAAMPSLHFGYSFLIGLTIATAPVRGRMWKRLAIICTGMIYPAIILAAIVATANHFILDAVAGALVCVTAWYGNGFLLNLLPVEDYFLWVLRMHKPEKTSLDGKGPQLRI
ncbi:integral membrane protein [Phialemonium atrogriseum]|uniref:Integral membrane protein n=1 Tax=Phialemonium atrogriseum TaxID=1093897 RepID=A0AAJ0BTE5_9PEZI|nr:uncharacterized protein QBC33DRAFT_548258 [Phialemonium atrogriseum]KAK1764168.1 integral membrane protein [Phialemonium atrogriseum]